MTTRASKFVDQGTVVDNDRLSVGSPEACTELASATKSSGKKQGRSRTTTSASALGSSDAVAVGAD
jgi:hypothetical protein